MNLQENIQRIKEVMDNITSNKRHKQIMSLITRDGLFHTAKMFGGFDKLRSIINDDIPKDIIAEEITNILGEKGLLGLGEGNWIEPIVFKTDEDGEHQIAFLGVRNAGIDIVVNGDYDTLETYNISYFNLPTKILLKICEIIEENIDHLQ